MKDIPHLTTLCYIEQDDCYLMMHRISKKHDINGGKWVGVGGHFKEGETPEECLVREAYEETGLTLTHYTLRGIITFLSDEWGCEYMFLYTADCFRGELTPEFMAACPEGPLSWVPKDKIKGLPVWEGDKIFLDLLLTEPRFFTLRLQYRGDDLVDSRLNVRD